MKRYAVVAFSLMSLMLWAQVSVKVKATPTGHSATFTWTPAVSGNIYRGTLTGKESTTPLNPSPVIGTYIDSTVTGLSTYYYTVKAYCSTCSPDLSPSSNEVVVTVPGDPQPQPPVLNTPVIN